MKVKKSILQSNGAIVKIRSIGENTLEVRGIMKGRLTRRYTAYMPEEELGYLMRKAQEEGVGISALTRLVVGAFVESGLSLKEYRKRMSKYREKGKEKKT